jgi:hypothetical protein
MERICSVQWKKDLLKLMKSYGFRSYNHNYVMEYRLYTLGKGSMNHQIKMIISIFAYNLDVSCICRNVYEKIVK